MPCKYCGLPLASEAQCCPGGCKPRLPAPVRAQESPKTSGNRVAPPWYWLVALFSLYGVTVCPAILHYNLQFAKANGFGKVIHIESDSFVRGDRLKAYINDASSGWTALWCPRHRMPESAIQIIAGSAVAESM